MRRGAAARRRGAYLLIRMHLLWPVRRGNGAPLPQLRRRITAPAAAPGEGGGMTRRLISSGSAFEKVAGYSRAVVDGEWIFVSGTTGFDYKTMTIAEDIAAQARQTFAN